MPTTRPSDVATLILSASSAVSAVITSAGDSFSARVSIEKPTSDGVPLTSSVGCIAFVGVYAGNDRHEEFEGTKTRCLAVWVDFVVLPQDPIITV